MLAFCIMSASYEFEIRDQYRFIEAMPFSGINYLTSSVVIVISLFLSIIDSYWMKLFKKKTAVLLVISFGFVVITTVRNYVYYSKEIQILNDHYTKEITVEELNDFINREVSATIYINAGEWEEAQQAYYLIKKYAYKEKKQIYILSAQNNPDLFSDDLNNILDQLQINSLPAVVFMESGSVQKTINYNEVCKWLDEYFLLFSAKHL